MRITKVNIQNGLQPYQLTKQMERRLIEFRKEHHTARIKELITGGVIFVANALNIFAMRESDESLREAQNYFKEHEDLASRGEPGISIPLDISLLRPSIDRIKGYVGTNNDWLAIWFAIEVYINFDLHRDLLIGDWEV